MNRIRRAVVVLVGAACALVVLALPAGAQQLIDAGGENQGGLAFIAFAVMVFLITASLFFMDHVRRRRSGESD